MADIAMKGWQDEVEVPKWEFDETSPPHYAYAAGDRGYRAFSGAPHEQEAESSKRVRFWRTRRNS